MSGAVLATSTAHGLTGTSSKLISGTADYDGLKTITVVDVDHFYFTATFIGNRIGWWSVNDEGLDNVGIGANSGRNITIGSKNIFIGSQSGYHASQKVDASNSIAIGYGTYTTADNQVIIGGLTNTSVDITGSTSIVGIGSTTGVCFKTKDNTNNVKFKVLDNGDVILSNKLSITPATAAATATTSVLPITSGNVEISTTGAAVLSLPTAGAIVGQLINLYVVAVSNSNDTLVITPTTLLGGTHITFGASALGKGCQMIYTTSGWCIVGNNGGTIS